MEPSFSLRHADASLHRSTVINRHELVRVFCESVRVLPFDAAASEAFGKLSVQLARRETPIGVIDTLIAAHALATERTLVTNNTRHFQRVAGLTLENWR